MQPRSRRPEGSTTTFASGVDHIFAPVPSAASVFRVQTEYLCLPISWPFVDYGGASGGVCLGNANLEVRDRVALADLRETVLIGPGMSSAKGPQTSGWPPVVAGSLWLPATL